MKNKTIVNGMDLRDADDGVIYRDIQFMINVLITRNEDVGIIYKLGHVKEILATCRENKDEK